jgi:hypothetical protein
VKSHAPALQTAVPFAGASQACPHSPQFFGFWLVSTQLASHFSKPVAQAKPQLDTAQVALPCTGDGHATSHAPQWFGEVARSRHAPPQLVSVASQLALHAPFEQTSPDAQALPQAPQCAGSLVRSVQEASQADSGALHVSLHLPLTQLAVPPVSGQ